MGIPHINLVIDSKISQKIFSIRRLQWYVMQKRHIPILERLKVGSFYQKFESFVDIKSAETTNTTLQSTANETTKHKPTTKGMTTTVTDKRYECPGVRRCSDHRYMRLQAGQGWHSRSWLFSHGQHHSFGAPADSV